MKTNGTVHLIGAYKSRVNTGMIGLFFVFIFFFSNNAFWGYNLFLTTDIIPLMACLLPIALIIIHYLSNDFRVNAKIFISILLLYLIIVIRSSFDPKAVLYYGLCISLFFYNDIFRAKKMLKWFYVFAIICMIGTFLPQ